MRIMKTAGHDIGFSPGAWRKIEATVLTKKAQSDDPYWTSLQNLPLVSVNNGQPSSSQRSDFVRSPASPWGGREVPLGDDHSATIRMTLSGTVVVPTDVTALDDEALKEKIKTDLAEAWSENNACFEEVEETRKDLHGERSDNDEVEAVVTSLSRAGESADVTAEIQVTVHSYESEFEARQRAEDERGDAALERRKERGL